MAEAAEIAGGANVSVYVASEIMGLELTDVDDGECH